jgi:hypothetical protein
MDWVVIVVGAAFGAVGGALGALVGRAFKTSFSRRAVTVIPVVLFIVLGNQVMTPIVREWWADARARTPFEGSSVDEQLHAPVMTRSRPSGGGTPPHRRCAVEPHLS